MRWRYGSWLALWIPSAAHPIRHDHLLLSLAIKFMTILLPARAKNNRPFYLHAPTNTSSPFVYIIFASHPAPSSSLKEGRSSALLRVSTPLLIVLVFRERLQIVSSCTVAFVPSRPSTSLPFSPTRWLTSWSP